MPVDVADAKVNRLTYSYPIGGDESQNRVVAFPGQSRLIRHGEQLLNVLPRNRLGETVEFAREDNWYRINQRALDQAVRVGESEKAAQT
jgi:hypothetical protein